MRERGWRDYTFLLNKLHGSKLDAHLLYFERLGKSEKTKMAVASTGFLQNDIHNNNIAVISIVEIS